jgi:hypothetical protein
VTAIRSSSGIPPAKKPRPWKEVTLGHAGSRWLRLGQLRPLVSEVRQRQRLDEAVAPTDALKQHMLSGEANESASAVGPIAWRMRSGRSATRLIRRRGARPCRQPSKPSLAWTSALAFLTT